MTNLSPWPRTMFCALCGDHARHPKSPRVELRRKECPRFPSAVIHRGCCAHEPCSTMDARGHVRCGWESGGKERLAAHLHAQQGRAGGGGGGGGGGKPVAGAATAAATASAAAAKPAGRADATN